MASGNQIIEDDRRSIMSEASQIVYQLKKGDITEVKSFPQPPEAVKDVLTAILILTGCPKSEQTWNVARQKMSKSDFTKLIAEFDIKKIPEKTRQEAMVYLSKYNYGEVMKKSMAVAALYNWAIEAASS